MQSVQWLVFIKDCIQFKQTEQHAHSCPHSGLACSTFVSSRRKTKKNRISFVCVCVEGSEEKEPFRVPSQARPPTLHLVVHRLYFFLLSFFLFSVSFLLALIRIKRDDGIYWSYYTTSTTKNYLHLIHTSTPRKYRPEVSTEPDGHQMMWVSTLNFYPHHRNELTLPKRIISFLKRKNKKKETTKRNRTETVTTQISEKIFVFREAGKHHQRSVSAGFISCVCVCKGRERKIARRAGHIYRDQLYIFFLVCLRNKNGKFRSRMVDHRVPETAERADDGNKKTTEEE